MLEILSPGDGATDDAATALAARRAAAEAALLGAVLAEPRAGLIAAVRAGVSFHDFGQPDLRLIFLAVETVGARGVGAVLVLARRALADAGFWDDSQIAGNFSVAMRWSDASLAALATSAYPNPELVRVRAERLLWLGRAQGLAQKLLDRADAVLQMAISPIRGGRGAA